MGTQHDQQHNTLVRLLTEARLGALSLQVLLAELLRTHPETVGNADVLAERVAEGGFLDVPVPGLDWLVARLQGKVAEISYLRSALGGDVEFVRFVGNAGLFHHPGRGGRIYTLAIRNWGGGRGALILLYHSTRGGEMGSRVDEFPIPDDRDWWLNPLVHQRIGRRRANP